MSNQGDDPYGSQGGGGDWQSPREDQQTGWDDPNQPGHQGPGHQGPGHQGPMIHQPPPPQGQGRSDLPLEQNDIIAIIVSLFIPGVGQLMLGQTPKGIAFLAVMFFTCWGLGLLPIVAALDAYLVARARKYRAIGDWEFFPDYKEAFNL